jgi:preprotein translocase subunit Sss1
MDSDADGAIKEIRGWVKAGWIVEQVSEKPDDDDYSYIDYIIVVARKPKQEPTP